MDINERVNNVCLVILATVAITVALIYCRPVLVPFVFAIFFYAIVSPIVKWLQTKWKLPHSLSVGISVIVFVLVTSLLWLFIFNSIDNFVTGAKEYQTKILDFIGWIADFANRFGYELNAASIKKEILQLPVFSVVKDITGGMLTLLANVSLIMIFVLFMLSGEGKNKRPKLFEEIQLKISRYAVTKILTSVSTGILVGIVLALFGVDLMFMFVILTILLNFIPSIGSVIAVLIPIPVILLQYGAGIELVAVLALTGGIQLLIGNIIEPKLMGESMDLHPITIMLFLMFWGLVWGVPGMFLAVPITAILKIILGRIHTTKVLSEAFAGRFSAS